MIGNLGKDPVFKAFENQTEATMFSSGEEPAEKKGIYRFPLATSKSGKKQDGTFATTTTWHQVSTTNPAYGNKLKTGYALTVSLWFESRRYSVQLKSPDQ